MTTLSVLKAPARNLAAGRFSTATPEAVDQWLNELPKGHPETCARQLLGVLEEANRAPLQRLSRLDFAERLRPAVYEVTETLARRFGSQPLPLRGRDQEQAAIVQSLLAELGAGFKLAVNDILHAGRLDSGNRLTLQIATQRALLAHGRGLLESYRVHAPEPPGTWTDVHKLYRNAEAVNLQATPIEGTRDAEETLLSIRQAYLRIAILALANPYHLSQDEAPDLYRRIGRWIHFARLSDIDASTPMQGRFITDLDSDLPPRYVSRQQRALPPANPRELDVTGVVNVLDQQIATLKDSLKSGRNGGILSLRLQHDTYQRFRDALGGRQERATPRSPTVSRLQLVSGLGACHYLIHDQTMFNPGEDEQRWMDKVAKVSGGLPRGALSLADKGSYLGTSPSAPPRHKPLFHGRDAELDDIWQKANRIGPDTTDEQAAPPPDYEPQLWSRKNMSAGGMALFCPRDSRTRTRVGEVVAWTDGIGATIPSGEHWSLGVVRWLRTRDHGGLELGVQELAESAYAAGCRAVSGSGQSAGYVRALLLPRINPMQGEASLIVPAALFTTDTMLALNLSKLILYARLTDVIETTRLFTHFRFKLSQGPDRRP